ncbi:6-phospho-alpha-glucosidase [Acetivibrio ethanolgignens]|uniref:6-phospho-alpha-glucosidase n=1 Tax=Acetivibrio ethanolgignens TaxID=290052 RepID=A0A0V8QA29_9FIRM|nr:6-phospho-alpha-glucosidase [Acetivibrio ethanolgignens]KSV57467.1 6-phospho-alpha-glucosidase [Acetivibrio ethanolgignens]
MKQEFKIVICGGGSTYTPGIVKDLLQEKALRIKELWLYDIDKERQDKVALIVREVIKSICPTLAFHVSTVPGEALLDADFIMAQMRVGKLEMRVRDEKIALKHGCIGQETCGAGGMAYGMRTIYPMVELIDLCEKYATKDYWIVNYSNPAAIVAKATQKLRPHARILNICDMPVEIEARMAEILGVSIEDLETDYFGLNHYGWFTKVRCKGEDVTEQLKNHVSEHGYLSKASYDDALVRDPDWLHTFQNAGKIMRLFPDYLPNTYWQYYLLGDDILSDSDIENTRGLQVIQNREKKVLKAAWQLEQGHEINLEQFYVGIHGKFIVSVVKALAYDTRSRQLVIVPNQGIIKNLPEDAMVEVPAYLTSRGPEPIRIGSIPSFYKGLMEQQNACEELLVEAAIEGSYSKALQAFTMNRTIPSANIAKEILDEMIEANKEYWPELK